LNNLGFKIHATICECFGNCYTINLRAYLTSQQTRVLNIVKDVHRLFLSYYVVIT